MSLEKETMKWEGIRASAISNWNGLDYARACDFLGLTPEFPDLYEAGCAERMSLRNYVSFFEEQNVQKTSNKYIDFYKEGVSLSKTSFGSKPCEKRRLLQKYFPKFGKLGREPIDKLEDEDVGAIFNRIILYAEKKVKTTVSQ
jgi:hypothetical protein